MRTTVVATTLLAAFAIGATQFWACGQEMRESDVYQGQATERAAQNAIQPMVVLRIAQSLVDDLVPKNVEESFPIDTTVGATTFRGAGVATGSVEVDFHLGTSAAQFVVSIHGQTTKSFVGWQDPITFHARSRGPFVASSRVVFAGHQFAGQPTTAWSRPNVTIHRLCSRQRRLVGRVVRRIGRRRVAEARPKMRRYISERVQTSATEALDSVVSEVVTELNRLIADELVETIRMLEPSAADWQWQLSATKDYLQAAVGPHPATVPDMSQIQQPLKAEIELWVRLDPLDATALSLAAMWTDSHELLKSFLPREEAERLPREVGVRAVGDWAVINVGRPL